MTTRNELITRKDIYYKKCYKTVIIQFNYLIKHKYDSDTLLCCVKKNTKYNKEKQKREYEKIIEEELNKNKYNRNSWY